MNKKIIISSVILVIIIFAGFYLYNKTKINPKLLSNEEDTTVAETQKVTLGQITFIDSSHLRLKEIVKDTNCFDSMNVDVDNDSEIKEKSIEYQKGVITQKEWDKFFVETVNKKYNNNLAWCPYGVRYIETGREITLNLNNDTVFTTFSFEDSEHPDWNKVISKEHVIQQYNTSEYAFHGRIEITSLGSNALKVHNLYQE